MYFPVPQLDQATLDADCLSRLISPVTKETGHADSSPAPLFPLRKEQTASRRANGEVLTDICFQIPSSPLPMSCCILTPTQSRFYPGLFPIFLGQWLWQGQAYAVASAEPGCPQGLRPPGCQIDLKSVSSSPRVCVKS